MFAIQEAVAELLSGIVVMDGIYGGFIFESTSIELSDFVTFDPFNTTYAPNFDALVEELLVNLTISLNCFLYNAPVSQINTDNASNPIIQKQVVATITTFSQAYEYNPVLLLQVYLPSIVASIICVILGCYALFQNGVDSDLSFSQILVTTRNETLDRESQGAWLGGEYISKSLRKLKLRYGRLPLRTSTIVVEGESNAFEYAGFGLEEEVMSLMKNRRHR
jgi:hypothetical protein